MRKNKNKNKKTTAEIACAPAKSDEAVIVIQGHNLHSFLSLLQRAIETAKEEKVDGNYSYSSLPPKLWFKQQFAIGVNEVTRTLERMPSTTTTSDNPDSLKPNLHLQAIIVSADCNPKWMAKHLHSLASTRCVPLILVRDQGNNNMNKAAASLKLGQLVNLKTAMAIGIKTKGSAINQIMEKIIHSEDANLEKMLLVQLETS